MEDEGNSTETAPESAPVPVVVMNVADFHEDLAKKVAAAVVVAIAVSVVKIGIDELDEKRKARKARKEAEKTTELKSVD